MKKLCKYLIILSAIVWPTLADATDIDQALAERIKLLRLSPLEDSEPVDPAIYQLGKEIFNDTIISGNKNISCKTCHNPDFGTGDAIPFSIGEGGIGEGSDRIQADGVAVPRNSPHLYNLGYPSELRFMFWDGRVSYSPHYNTYRTPEPALNTASPAAPEITAQFNGALSAQTIFPITSHEEMRGKKGENELADATTNLEVWDLTVKRLLNEKKYRELFRKAFGNQKINIGHVGRSLGDFITQEFNYNDTPYDRYLKGDKSALTKKQKVGMDIFFGKGKCFSCHKGTHLGGNFFNSAGAPEISLPSHKIDRGLFDTTGRGRDQFKFMSKTLRNTALTAPFMHNGALKDLEAVVDHYNDVPNRLENYEVPMEYFAIYNEDILVDRDEKRNSRRKAIIFEAPIKFGLGLSDKEKSALVDFLKYGLTDISLHDSLN